MPDSPHGRPPTIPGYRHIVGGCGTHRQIGVCGGIAKLARRILGHTLYFESKDAQAIHDRRHTGGNHTEILSAGEHIGSLDDWWKFLHGFAAPEGIVAAVEEIIVKGGGAIVALIILRLDCAGGVWGA